MWPRFARISVLGSLVLYTPGYGGCGGPAYHHVSDRYVALFSHFIPCGVWEAVYIIDGLLKNKSDIQPDTFHADTQGQSTPVFALAHLLVSLTTVALLVVSALLGWMSLTAGLMLNEGSALVIIANGVRLLRPRLRKGAVAHA